MAIKLFVTDLDGTLLRSGSPVSHGNVAAVQRAVRAGVTVTIATGRMFRAAMPVAQQLGVDVPIITYNGALIKRVSGEVLYQSCLPQETVREVARFCRAQGWYVQLYSNDELYYVEECPQSRIRRAFARCYPSPRAVRRRMRARPSCASISVAR